MDVSYLPYDFVVYKEFFFTICVFFLSTIKKCRFSFNSTSAWIYKDLIRYTRHTLSNVPWLAGVDNISIQINFLLFNHLHRPRTLFLWHCCRLSSVSSAGKTSIVEYLAARLGHRCVRINNHEHTDIQEYTGTYAADGNGKLSFQEVSLLV